MNPITVVLALGCAVLGVALGETVNIYLAPPFIIAAILIALSLKMANAWQKFVILRAGKLQSVKGPGLFLIIPVVDNVAAVIDERIQTTAFNAEQALTKDTVPVNVDAIIFWHVHDARRAALEITDYRQAIDRVAQTSLREMIGSSMLSALLSERQAADARLRDEIGRKTAEWGVSVTSVEIRDVAIPVALQDAMSRQAQAEREKQARVILGSAEAEIAGKFVEAAKVYADHPAALQLRAMNIIYETTKERGTTILIPTSMVDSMNPASALVLAGQAASIEGKPPLRTAACGAAADDATHHRWRYPWLKDRRDRTGRPRNRRSRLPRSPRRGWRRPSPKLRGRQSRPQRKNRGLATLHPRLGRTREPDHHPDRETLWIPKSR
jgi:regulator of protease activity HflC (stomatin/prohibitin superfamily)